MVGVTSAQSGEGCTSIATIIAVWMAKNGHTVLLVDGNISAPKLHTIFKNGTAYNLKEIMDGAVTVNNATKSPVTPNLTVITSGENIENPHSVYLSETFSSLLEYVRKRFELVIIDLPPVIPYPATKVVFKHIRSLLLVIQAERESHNVVRKAKEEIERSGGTILGVVLNRGRYH